MRVVTDPHIHEYLQDKGISLCSYETAHFETTFTSHEEKKKRIIMMLSMKEGTGNTITGTRIASLLLSLGYAVQMVDTTDCYEQQNIQATIHNCNYNRHSLFYCLFSIHAIRSGVYAYHAGVPYVVMLGGTDINVNVNDSKKAQMIYSVLMNAKHIIAFTQDMKDRTESFLTNSQHPPITVIPQVSYKRTNMILYRVLNYLLLQIMKYEQHSHYHHLHSFVFYLQVFVLLFPIFSILIIRLKILNFFSLLSLLIIILILLAFYVLLDLFLILNMHNKSFLIFLLLIFSIFLLLSYLHHRRVNFMRVFSI